MERTLGILKALADGNRLRVVMALCAHKELCVCRLTEMLGIAMATVSRHMSILQAAGVVAHRKESRWVHYRLREDFPVVLRKWLQQNLQAAQEVAADNHMLRRALSCSEQPNAQATPRRSAARKQTPVPRTRQAKK